MAERGALQLDHDRAQQLKPPKGGVVQWRGKSGGELELCVLRGCTGEHYDGGKDQTRECMHAYVGVLHVRIQMRPLKKERMRKHKGVTINY